MTKLILDSGAVSHLANEFGQPRRASGRVHRRSSETRIVPSVVLVECLQGKPHTDAHVNRFLKSCKVSAAPDEALARRAAYLRTRAGTGSAVDAVVVAMADPGGTVLATDLKDCRALAAHAQSVRVLAA